MRSEHHKLYLIVIICRFMKSKKGAVHGLDIIVLMGISRSNSAK